MLQIVLQILKNYDHIKIRNYFNLVTMQSDTPNGKKITLDNKSADILRQRYNKFKATFQSEQAKFRTSSTSVYYIVSTQYLKDWIDFCRSNSLDRYQPRCMNQDLMDAGGQLRRGLVQKQDFQIVNENIFELIKLSKFIVIERKAVIVENEKRVPIYLDHIKYIKLQYKDIRGIDLNSIFLKNLNLKTIQFPMQDLISSLIIKIRQNQKLSSKSNIRLWKNNQNDVSIEKMYKQIKQKTRYMMSSYRLDGFGKLIQNQDVSVSDLNLGNGDYFIAQVQEQYSNHFFKTPGQNKCEGCGKYRKLPFICGCKQVAYCTEECKQKDRRFHVRDCKFAEQQQLNQQIQMVITQKSMRGKVGLSNLGNTCFMNSCLQCLSNTDLLTLYFLNKYYQHEINKDNPLGSGGRLSKNYAKFIKNMWCSTQQSYSPYSLKSAVAKINPIFSGYAQHDSQQFFSFIVDGIHEDLNRVAKKPYVQSVQSKNRPDQVVALESWIAYTQRNQSIIVDLMTGQYKSKVICPTCNLQSITFDPFTTVSLPIPESATPGTMKYFIIFTDHEQQTLRASFQYLKADTKQWLQTATKQLKRDPSQFCFYVLTVYENIYNFNTNSKAEILHKIQAQNKYVFLLQYSPEQRKMKQRIQIPTRLCKKSLHYSNEYDNLWFKRPFFFQKQKTKVSNIYQRIIKYLFRIYYKKLDYNQYFNKMLKQRPFALILKTNKTIQRTYNRVQTQFKKQFALEDEDIKLSDILKNLQANDFQLDVRFTKESAKLFQFQKLKSFSDANNTKSVKKQQYKQDSVVTLDQCFNVFQQQQKLDPGNQWYCPKCKQHKLATKQMTIYKAPEILILHLKRFKNKGILRKQKNQTTVVFPTVLNMKKYLIDPQPMSSYIPEMKKQNKYIQPVFKVEATNSEPMYDLYAISNHYGGLGGGHYTAYAKNGQKWLQYNDSSVRVASEQSIMGSGAYMLFYKRRNSFKFI